MGSRFVSDKEARRRQTARVVMIQSWLYKRRNPAYIDLSLALTLGWALVRSRAYMRYTKARGTTFERRQQKLEILSRIPDHRISLRLQPERDNPHDEHAIKIFAAIDGIRQACVGYLPKELAAKVSCELTAGKRPVAFYNGITGGYGRSYGLNLSFVLIEQKKSRKKRQVTL